MAPGTRGPYNLEYTQVEGYNSVPYEEKPETRELMRIVGGAGCLRKTDMYVTYNDSSSSRISGTAAQERVHKAMNKQLNL